MQTGSLADNGKVDIYVFGITQGIYLDQYRYKKQFYSKCY